MTHISQEQVNWSTRWPCRWAVTVLICALLPAGLWSSSGSAQEPTPQELKPLDTASAQEPTPQELKPLDSVHPKPKKLSRAPVTKPPSLPKPMSVVAPGNATILGGSLATELASCDKGTERSEPLRLPGAKGDSTGAIEDVIILFAAFMRSCEKPRPSSTITVRLFRPITRTSIMSRQCAVSSWTTLRRI
jgi:hypothetical protein